MGEHTPGPWFGHWSIEGQSWSILAEDGHMLANAFESEGNARFITAAPDLADVAQEILDEVDAPGLDISLSRGVVDRLRAVLAKARGE